MKFGNFAIRFFVAAWLDEMVRHFNLGVPAHVRIDPDCNAHFVYTDGTPDVPVGVVDESVFADLEELKKLPPLIPAPAKPAKLKLIKAPAKKTAKGRK